MYLLLKNKKYPANRKIQGEVDRVSTTVPHVRCQPSHTPIGILIENNRTPDGPKSIPWTWALKESLEQTHAHPRCDLCIPCTPKARVVMLRVHLTSPEPTSCTNAGCSGRARPEERVHDKITRCGGIGDERTYDVQRFDGQVMVQLLVLGIDRRDPILAEVL